MGFESRRPAKRDSACFSQRSDHDALATAAAKDLDPDRFEAALGFEKEPGVTFGMDHGGRRQREGSAPGPSRLELHAHELARPKSSHAMLDFSADQDALIK
ncbi:MAG: hypothetical protein ACJAYI_000413 [Myxococcota bacterium]|jgi:hypothetical protein